MKKKSSNGSRGSRGRLMRHTSSFRDLEMLTPTNFVGRVRKVFQQVFLLLVLHPFTKPRMIWDFWGMALCIHDVTMLPMTAFELGESYRVFRETYELFSACFWTIDIPLNFSTGFISPEGLLEMRKKVVAKHYIRTWFFPDLLITVLDWYALIAEFNNSGALRLGKAATRSLRALRLLRLPKMSRSVSEILGSMNSENLLTIAGIVKFLLILILVTHYVACMWYTMADSAEEETPTWAKQFLQTDYSQGYGYATAMHWALTQFTPASMEVVPVNLYERIYTCIVIIVAMVIFSSFVSSITQAMTHLRMTHMRKIEQELLLRKYFSEYNTPRELAARCKHFLKQHERLANKRIRATEIPCVNILPKAIREELRYEAFFPFLTSHPFFEYYSELCPMGLRHICTSAVEEESLLPLEELFWHGHAVNRMIFVRAGLLYYDSGACKPIEVQPGEWACEETLWSKVSMVAGPFRAASSGCELLMVLPSEFQLIARIHPPSLRFAASYAQEFIDAFNFASEDMECEDLLFNTHNTIVDIVNDACGSKTVPYRAIRSTVGAGKGSNKATRQTRIIRTEEKRPGDAEEG